MLSPVLILWSALAAPADYFQIEVVDDRTGRGVPLVELETTNHIRYVTDSNGRVAFFEPGLMDQLVFFHVRSHGYEFPADGFGSRGKALRTTPGASTTLRLHRQNIAERLYRVTGQGIYADTQRLGQPAPLRAPLINGLVMGSDSVVNAVYQGKLYWFWGDTNRPAHPLGNFHVPGAISSLPADGGLDPSVGVELTYFLDASGFARAMAPLPGPGPTWIFGLTVVHDAQGRQRMFAAYSKIKPPLEAYQRGLCEFNDQTQTFEKRVEFPLDAPVQPGGHSLIRPAEGLDYVYFCQPFPLVRVRATADDVQHLDRYEAYTCLAEGSRLERPSIDRGPDGAPRYAWKRNTPPLGPADEARLVKTGHLQPHDAWLQLMDESGQGVLAHAGSVCWNDYRGRYVLIATQQYGTSFLGEVWYAEADTPSGPWVFARKVLTHDNYSFYNPKQHAMFDQDGGRRIYFEGTYTHTFSSNQNPTPRYDYNQLMYRLDLADPRLVLPVPIYRLATAALSPLGPRDVGDPGRCGQPIAFFALDRPRPGSVAIVAEEDRGQPRLVVASAGDARTSAALFHALPASLRQPPPHVVPLWEYVSSQTGQRVYTTEAPEAHPGFTRASAPLCHVWQPPGPWRRRP